MWYRYYPQYSQYYVLVSQSLTVEGIRGFVPDFVICSLMQNVSSIAACPYLRRALIKLSFCLMEAGVGGFHEILKVFGME